MDLGRVLQVGEAAAQLVADQALGADQSFEACLLLLGLPEHADPDPGRTEIGGHPDLGDADEPDPGVLQVVLDDVHDLLADLARHLGRSITHLFRPSCLQSSVTWVLAARRPGRWAPAKRDVARPFEFSSRPTRAAPRGEF